MAGEWVKGHYSGKNRKIQHDLNDKADELAGIHLDNQNFRSGTNISHIPNPGYTIRLLKDNCVITSKYRSIICYCHHEQQLQNYILKRTKWSHREFHQVHWTAHGAAFTRLSRHQQITMAKLIHNLANTNRQSHLYYKTSPLCPGCTTEEETFEHVLRCAFPHTVVFRNSLLQTLERDLSNIQTPPPVITAIMKGFHDWFAPTSNHSRSPTYGSLFGPDILLTSAYYERFYKLSWFQLCLGRISLKWSQAVHSYHSSTSPMFDANRWAAKFIFCLWQFTKQLWTFRNQLVNGDTVEETVSAQLNLLHGKVTHHYNQYQESTAYVLPCHEYLFTQRSLEDCLKMSYDSITPWLRSVSEAHQILAFQQSHLQETAASFFRLF